MKKTFLLFVFVAIFDCCKPSWVVGKSAECREFYGFSIQERDAAFQTFSIEKQLRIYLCGMDREPADIARAYDIAAGGEKVVPYLAESLKASNDDYDRDSIVYILEVLSERGQLRGRQDIVDLVREVVSKMRSDVRKEITRGRLSTIERNAT